MISSWSNDSMLAISRKREVFSVSDNKTSYSIGPNLTELPDDESGIDFVTVRPIEIISATVKLGNVDYPLSIIADDSYIDGLAIKNTLGIPRLLNYDNAYPTGNIFLYPTPSADYSITLMSDKPLLKLETLDSSFDFPPGWEEAVIYNLAIRLAGQYGQPVTAILDKMAKESLGSIRKAILRNRNLDANYRNKTNNVYSGWTR